jgi:uncharacterized Zn finger protein
MPWGYYPPKPSVAERRAQAARDLKRLQKKKGKKLDPILLGGRRKIAHTFWGKAWCDNIEAYRDLANRLARGRSYVRHDQVIDLSIAPGVVSAQVSGSSVYQVQITIKTLPGERWQALVERAAGQIDSMISLLQGKLSEGVIQTFCEQEAGLFPSSREISFSCSCPDHAIVCKHVAATMYGIGVRLDVSPELLFRLRDVDESALLQSAAQAEFASAEDDSAFADDDLSALFGIELDTSMAEAPDTPPPASHALLHEALMVVLIAILLGAERWSEVEALAAEHREALLGLLPLEDGSALPTIAPARTLAPALDIDRIERWLQALVSTADRRCRPDNRLQRGLAAALAVIPKLPLRAEGGRIPLDGQALPTLLSLLKSDRAGVIIGAADPGTAATIADSGGVYYARASGPLEEELALFFHDASVVEYDEIDHVLIESGQRRLVWVEWVDWMSEAGQWRALDGIIMIEEGAQQTFYLTNGDSSLAEQAAGILRLRDTELWLAPYPVEGADLLPDSLEQLAERLLSRAGHRSRRALLSWRKVAATDHRKLLQVLGA